MIKMFISEELLTISRKSDPLEALKISQIKWKLQTDIDCVGTWGKLWKVQHPSLDRYLIDSIDTQFLSLKSAGINNPEVSEKYNNIEVKYGATFLRLPVATCHLTPTVVTHKYRCIWGKKLSLGSIIIYKNNKITWIL
jgi:hypothetical protein